MPQMLLMKSISTYWCSTCGGACPLSIFGAVMGYVEEDMSPHRANQFLVEIDRVLTLSCRGGHPVQCIIVKSLRARQFQLMPGQDH